VPKLKSINKSDSQTQWEFVIDRSMHDGDHGYVCSGNASVFFS